MRDAIATTTLISLGLLLGCAADPARPSSAEPTSVHTGSGDGAPTTDPQPGQTGETHGPSPVEGTDPTEGTNPTDDTHGPDPNQDTDDPTAPPSDDTGQPPPDNGHGEGPSEGPPCSLVPPHDAAQSFEATLPSGDAVDVYYPSPSAAADGTLPERLPVAVLLQGANVARGHYSDCAAAVARYAFIVVVADHSDGLLGGFGTYTEMSVINESLAYAAAQDTEPGSPLAGQVDTTRSAVIGHSFGGVAGMYAIANNCSFPFCSGSFERPASLRAGVFYGTTLQPPNPAFGDIPITENDGIGIMLIQGSLDSLALGDAARATYDKVADPPKALVTIAGANHYGITNTNNPAGANAETQAPTVPQAVSIERIARWTGRFLRAFVADDTACVEALQNAADGNPDGDDGTSSDVSVIADL